MSQPDIKFRKIVIRTEEDISKNKKILTEAGEVLCSSGMLYTPSDFFDYIKLHLTVTPRIFLLFDKGDMVSVLLGHSDYYFKYKFNITHLGTRKELQKRRYGTRLIAEAIGYILLKKGFEEVDLSARNGTQKINRKVFENSKKYLLLEQKRTNPEYLSQTIIKKNNLLQRKVSIKPR